jgi:hypothetical protein
MTTRRCDDETFGLVVPGKPIAVGLIRNGLPDSWIERRRSRATLSVKAWLHGYRLVGMFELAPVPSASATAGLRCRDVERDVLDRMAELADGTGARTVLTLGSVDCPELEDALAWAGLRARPVERWSGRRNGEPRQG